MSGSSSGHRRALFVDRDGVLDFERSDYVKSIEELKMVPGACEKISRYAADYPLIIMITNQSVVGRGIISHEELKEINETVRSQFFNRAGRKIDAIYYCPHRPEENCNCRKPRTLLFQKAANDFDLDLGKCVFIGDKETDEEAARRIGCGFIRVKTNTSEVISKEPVFRA